jgi:hypothetical protein
MVRQTQTTDHGAGDSTAADPPPRLLTHAEAAKVLRCSPATLRSIAWRRKLGIPTVRIGNRHRYDARALYAWLRSRSGV